MSVFAVGGRARVGDRPIGDEISFWPLQSGGARQWGLNARIDGVEFKTLSNRIHQRVRKLSVAKVESLAVLQGAFELAKSGYALKKAYQIPWHYELRELLEPARMTAIGEIAPHHAAFKIDPS